LATGAVIAPKQKTTHLYCSRARIHPRIRQKEWLIHKAFDGSGQDQHFQATCDGGTLSAKRGASRSRSERNFTAMTEKHHRYPVHFLDPWLQGEGTPRIRPSIKDLAPRPERSAETAYPQVSLVANRGTSPRGRSRTRPLPNGVRPESTGLLQSKSWQKIANRYRCGGLWCCP